VCPAAVNQGGKAADAGVDAAIAVY
jgi:hypothetical protein